MRKSCVLLLFCACATVASAQVAEFSLSGGSTRISGNPLYSVSGNTVDLNNGFRLALRMTLNTWRFMGHEFGYGYSHSSVPGAVFGQGGNVAIPIHSGFYDFLVYGTPEGTRIRPFVAGGAQFMSFFPPGTSVYYGNQTTKFGINYGGGIKFRLSGPFGARVDVRQYWMGKPDIFQTPGLSPTSGHLRITEFTVGVSYNL